MLMFPTPAALSSPSHTFCPGPEVRFRKYGSVGQGYFETVDGLDEKRVYHEAGVDPQENVTVFFLKF